MALKLTWRGRRWNSINFSHALHISAPGPRRRRHWPVGDSGEGPRLLQPGPVPSLTLRAQPLPHASNKYCPTHPFLKEIIAFSFLFHLTLAIQVQEVFLLQNNLADARGPGSCSSRLNRPLLCPHWCIHHIGGGAFFLFASMREKSLLLMQKHNLNV